MQNHSLSKRYAKALFLGTGERGAVQTFELLKALSGSIETHAGFRNVLYNPSFGMDEKRRVLVALVERETRTGFEPQQVNYLKRFFSILIKKNRLIFLPGIVDEMEHLIESLSRTIPVVMTVPVTLSDEEKRRYSAKLEKAFNQKILLTVKVAPEILGGLTLQAGSKVFDASLQSKLGRLRQTLMGQ